MALPGGYGWLSRTSAGDLFGPGQMGALGANLVAVEAQQGNAQQDENAGSAEPGQIPGEPMLRWPRGTAAVSLPVATAAASSWTAEARHNHTATTAQPSPCSEQAFGDPARHPGGSPAGGGLAGQGGERQHDGSRGECGRRRRPYRHSSASGPPQAVIPRPVFRTRLLAKEVPRSSDTPLSTLVCISAVYREGGLNRLSP